MAANAGFVFQLAFGVNQWRNGRIRLSDCDRGSSRRSVMNGMAIVAANIVAGMASRFPKRQMAVSCVAIHAGARLFFRGYRAFVEAHRVGICFRIACMLWVEAVAGYASLSGSGRRIRVHFRAMLGIHDALLVLMTSKALLSFCLSKKTALRKEEDAANEGG
jgi:hypothetical protein